MGIDWPEDDDRGAKISASVFGTGKKVGLPAPDNWYDWATQLFPSHTRAPFANRHAELWEWAWAIERDSSPRPFVAIWGRGGAKSSSAELVCVGARGMRGYGWYVRATQPTADTSVQNIARLLESDSIARHYPAHGEREVGKFGNPQGWRRERLQTAGKLTIDALGVDTAARGTKVDDQRPDFIILDDIDEKHDSLKVSLKKIETITTSILPAMATNGAVLAIQNLIIPNGFFARLADGRADYLLERIVSGPHPVVSGLEIEHRQDEKTGTVMPIIVKGKATWAGQNIEACQHLLNTIGESAFMKECQHDVFGNKEGRALKVEAHHVEDLTDEQAKALVKAAVRSRSMSLIAGVDPGHWRFGFVLRVVDTTGRVRQIAEYFSQREGLGVRARAIDAIAKHYGYPPGFPIWADAANPTDILELNLKLTAIDSQYRILAVGMANKARQASVERINDLLDRNALTYRRDVVQAVAQILAKEFNTASSPKRPEDYLTWRLGWGAASPGVVMNGSRLRYETKEWSYPPTPEGEAQEQDPEDDSADGADLIAADRYCIMSWWQSTQEGIEGAKGNEDRDRTKIVDGRPILESAKDEMWKRFEEEKRNVQPQRRSVFSRRGTGTRKVDL